MTVASMMAWQKATDAAVAAEINWMQQINPLAYHEFLWAESANNASLAASLLDPSSSNGNGGGTMGQALGLAGATIGFGAAAYSDNIGGMIASGLAALGIATDMGAFSGSGDNSNPGSYGPGTGYGGGL